MTAVRPGPAFRLVGALAASSAGPSRVICARPLPRLLLAQGARRATLMGSTRLRWHSTASTSPTSDHASTSASTSASASTTKPKTESSQDGGMDATPSSDAEATLRLDAPAPGAKSQRIAQLEPRLSLTFTCTADDCGHRSTHEFAKRSYTKGIVLIQCPGCKNRHLIADNLGWFKESTEDGKLRTVEDLLRAKGEKVRTGKVNFDGDVEYDPES